MEDLVRQYGGLSPIFQEPTTLINTSGHRDEHDHDLVPVRPQVQRVISASFPLTGRASSVYHHRGPLRELDDDDDIVYQGGDELENVLPCTEPMDYPTGLDITDQIRGIPSRPRRQGGLSDVYCGYWQTPEGPVVKTALKVIRVPGASQESVQRKLIREILVWKSLDHPHILPLCGIHTDMGEYPAMVSPWCENGDIVTYLDARKFQHNIAALRLKALSEILNGLQYLHERNPPLVHGDLKGANILVSVNGEALLCDFGLASAMGEHSASRDTTTKGMCRYMAPELFHADNAPHTTYTDIWAIGCVALEIISGLKPYYDISNLQKVILTVYLNKLPTRPGNVPDSLWNFMLDCWTIEPINRPTAHFLLSKIDEEILLGSGRAPSPWSLRSWAGERRDRIVRSVSPWRLQNRGRRTCSPHTFPAF